MSELILRETFEEDGLLKHVFTKAKKHEVGRWWMPPIYSYDKTVGMLLNGIQSPIDLVISLIPIITPSRRNVFASVNVRTTISDFNIVEFGNSVRPVEYMRNTLWRKKKKMVFIRVEDGSGNLIPFWQPIDNFRIWFMIIYSRYIGLPFFNMGINWFLPSGMDLDAQNTIPTDIPDEWRTKYDEFAESMLIITRGRHGYRRRSFWNTSWYHIKNFMNSQCPSGTIQNDITRNSFSYKTNLELINWCKNHNKLLLPIYDGFPSIEYGHSEFFTIYNYYVDQTANQFKLDPNKKYLIPTKYWAPGLLPTFRSSWGATYTVVNNIKHFMPYMFEYVGWF